MKYLYIIILFSSFFVRAQIKIDQLNLMPWPQEISLKEGVFGLNKNFKINITGNPNPRIFQGATRFLHRLDGRTGLFFNQNYVNKINEVPDAVLQIHCINEGKIGIHEDESYTLEINSDKIILNASSDLGALHGLETLLQLLQNDATSYYFPNTVIKDFPRFTWRGLMIDAARHFMPVAVIKRNLDAMAALKMNVFHWHLSDDQGWRIEMKKNPKLTLLASDGYYYTQEEIKNIVKYADLRGIMIVPEIDVPGHASAILTAYPEISSKKSQYSIERYAGIFTPTLDPTNPKTYKILTGIFNEVCPLFSGDYFHIGGDENEGKDWDSNPEIQEFMKKKNLINNHELQTYFTIKLLPMLNKYHKKLMGWEEIMTQNMPKNALIHSWKGIHEGMKPGESLVKAVKNGYQTVLSNGYYIDLMHGVESHYLNDPMPKNDILTIEEKARILGGEATMWSELVTPVTIDSRIWPRTAAIAERLWSDEKIINLESMLKRLSPVSSRLEELGITFIKNKEVLLRNISNYQAINDLNDLSNVCEPLKGYTRNLNGTEYNMTSPLTLFADVCVPNAKDAVQFSKIVNSYVNDQSEENKSNIITYLEKWKLLNENLEFLSLNAPLIKPLLPLAKKLSDTSNLLLFYLNNSANVDKNYLIKSIEDCNSKEHADVELAVYESFKKLL